MKKITPCSNCGQPYDPKYATCKYCGALGGERISNWLSFGLIYGPDPTKDDFSPQHKSFEDFLKEEEERLNEELFAAEATKTCSNCGKQYPKELTYCQYCGSAGGSEIFPEKTNLDTFQILYGPETIDDYDDSDNFYTIKNKKN